MTPTALAAVVVLALVAVAIGIGAALAIAAVVQRGWRWRRAARQRAAVFKAERARAMRSIAQADYARFRQRKG